MSDASSEDARDKGEMRLIARAAAVLRALAERPSGLSLGEIAKATGLARSTVQRIVGALEVERLVSAGAAGVRLGLEISRLASFVETDARAALRPLAEELMRRAQETVDVTIFDGERPVVIDQVVSPQSLRVVSHVGRPLPLHATASGKAHLAQLSAAERGRLLAGALERHTAHTLVSAEALLDDIQTSLRRGYFLDREEYAEGVSAIAFAARLPGANVAIALSMPTSRFDSRLSDYIQALHDVAARGGFA